MRHLRFTAVMLGCCLGLCGSVTAVHATPTPSASAVDGQFFATNELAARKRDAYQKAKAAILRGDLATAGQLRRTVLVGYPLNVWLDYYTLTGRPSLEKFPQVKRFIALGEHQELSRLVRKKYVRYLSDRGQYAKVAELIGPKPYDDHLPLKRDQQIMQCRFYEANWHIGRGGSDAIAYATGLYLSPTPYPDDCAGLISWWREKGYRNENTQFEKFERAYITKRYKSVTQDLAGDLLSSPKYGGRIAQLMSWYDDPTAALDGVPATDGDAHRNAVLAFKRYANLNGRAAAGRYAEFCGRFEPNQAERLEMQQILALQLLGMTSTRQDVKWVDQHLPAVAWTNELIEKRLRRAIWFGQWRAVGVLVRSLPPSERQKSNWQYWAAHSALETGAKAEGEQLLSQVADDRSFFGFLAAQELKRHMPFKHKRLSPTAVWPGTVRDTPSVQRFFEMYAMGDSNAAVEWNEIAKTATEDQALLMADWALRSGNIRYAIQSVTVGQYWDALNYRFPAPYLDLYRKYASASNVSLSFLYGVSRQESMMNPKVKSPVGAVGLMQLMPGTARLVSQRHKWAYKGVSDLVIPENNIRLGSAYLRHMLDRFDNNRVLAASAYNAGPQRVDRWVSKDGMKRTAAAYVENIPFQETRQYVQNVLLYDAIYHKLLTGDERPLLTGRELSYAY